MSERFEFIDAEKATRTPSGERKYTVTLMCAWLEVSTSGFSMETCLPFKVYSLRVEKKKRQLTPRAASGWTW